MRRILKAAGLLAIAALSMAAAPVTSPNLPQTGEEPRLLAPNGLRGVGVDLAEIRLRLVGGYDGQWVSRADMKLVRTIEGVNFYRVKDRLYVDRDGDHVIDAGAVYVPRTGLVIADWDCDGRGDQMLFNMRPASSDGAGPLLKRVSAEQGPAR